MKASAFASAVLGFVVLVAWSSPVRACDPGEHAQQYDTNEALADTTPPVLSNADISIRRADDPGNNGGGCEELGGYTITVDASDDQTALADLGFALNLADGSLPFQLPEGDVKGDDPGVLRDWFVDDGEAFDGTLEVRVVDRAGNRSEPKRVSASGDAVGCSCSAAGAPSRNYSAFLGLAGLLLLARRRSTTS